MSPIVFYSHPSDVSCIYLRGSYITLSAPSKKSSVLIFPWGSADRRRRRACGAGEWGFPVPPESHPITALPGHGAGRGDGVGGLVTRERHRDSSESGSGSSLRLPARTPASLRVRVLTSPLLSVAPCLEGLNDSFADCGSRGAPKSNRRFDLRGEPECQTVVAELRRNFGAHVILDPYLSDDTVLALFI